MIPTLPELWYASLFVLAYAAIVIWRKPLLAKFRAPTYEGRHRPGLVPDYVPVSWRDAQEQRIAAILDDPIVSVDTTHYDQSAGSAHYLRLKDTQLEAGVEMLFTRTETYPRRLPLRGAVPPVGEIDDEAYELAVAE